jgi:addiction module HigA family antidote
MSREAELIKPSDMLAQWLTKKGITAYQLSKETLLPQSRISEILSGRRRITAETATILGGYFENSAEYWMGIQMRHDINESGKEGAERQICFGTLKIGSFEVSCYVLNDERRIISVSNFLAFFDIRTNPVAGAQKLASLIDSPYLQSEKIKKLIRTVSSPVKFVNDMDFVAYGYDGETVVEYCRAILDVRRIGGLADSSKRYADAAEMIVVSLAKVGIVALIDEATGFQAQRQRDALQKLFEAYFRKEIAAWTKRFPHSFYREIFRLKNWKWESLSTKKPPYVGKITNDIVYSRIDPKILEELQRRNPIQSNGHRKSKHHQWLTDEMGIPALSQHLYGLEMMMRPHVKWESFYHQLEKACPIKGSCLQLLLTDQ